MRRLNIALFTLSFLFMGCIGSAQLRDATLTAADCSLHTTVSCAMQSAVECADPAARDDNSWRAYARCLLEHGKNCQISGLSRCAMVGVLSAAGGRIDSDRFSTVRGPLSRASGCDYETVRLCVEDVTIESQTEAADAVAACYRMICAGGASPR